MECVKDETTICEWYVDISELDSDTKEAIELVVDVIPKSNMGRKKCDGIKDGDYCEVPSIRTAIDILNSIGGKFELVPKRG